MKYLRCLLFLQSKEGKTGSGGINSEADFVVAEVASTKITCRFGLHLYPFKGQVGEKRKKQQVDQTDCSIDY